ncbi:MAG: protein kinase [Thiotrichales bacterium]
MTILEQLENGELAGTTQLSLRADLDHIPDALYSIADTLEILDLNDNRLTDLPSDFARLRNLRILFLSQNHFKHIPPVLAKLPKLTMVGFKNNQIGEFGENTLPEKIRWLILTDNNLTTLPDDIGRYQSLQKLMLAGNHLRALPDSLADCHNLELLRISANQLPHLPAWLFSMPRQAWLACGGNPCFKPTHHPHTLEAYDWEELELDELLGQGASGEIFRASHPSKAEVAVKLFKGEVTSDGYPADEMRATIAAGQHPNLVSVHGQLNAHPEQKSGLVLALISPEYQNLGNPPDFESCTRDTYPANTFFTIPQVLRIARGIASTCEHLHARGVMHGDLYAHNILINDQGDPLLSDFGAASHYAQSHRETAAAFEHIEVRAYGCLLQDLLDRCNETNHATYKELRKLETACLNQTPEQRPLFFELLKNRCLV